MDNAMVKRGIGAVVLAVIAALLLGYLLKDKSRERQDAIEIKIPDAPELTIPSLTEVTDNVTGAAATIVDDTKSTVSNAGNAVVASASGSLNTLTSGAKNTFNTVTDGVSNTVDSVSLGTDELVNNVAVKVNTDVSNPGFSFRPSTKNEEQKINTPSSTKTIETPKIVESDNNTVVASVTSEPKRKVEKKFKPIIETESKKVVKKPVKKKTVKKKVASASGGKYSIQLLATSSQSRANKLAQTFKSEGYVSYITQTTSNNKILYRVRVGGYNDRDAALESQNSMQRRYQKNFFVQNSLVVSK